MTYSWLVEEFGPDGNSTGRYMLCQGALTITADVYAARKLRRQQSAGFRALDMKAQHGSEWRAVEHGFEDSKTPNVGAKLPHAEQPAPERAEASRVGST